MNLSSFRYSNQEWIVMKILTISIWLYPVIKVLRRYTNIPHPEGVCRFVDLTILLQSPVSVLLILAAVLLSGFYLTERYMIITTFFLALISVAVFSIERSNGIYHRKELLSIVFIVQFIAYAKCWIDKRYTRASSDEAIRYSVQVIATAYVIAGIAKLTNSGLGWIGESSNVAVQVLKSFSQKSIDLQSNFLNEYGRYWADLILSYPGFAKIMLATALGLELFAFVAFFGKKHAIVMGIVILVLHLGMMLFMGVFLAAFAGLVLIYLVNIPVFFASGKNHNVDVIAADEAPTGWMERAKGVLVVFFLPIVYILLSLILGENHPFSRFPMYSQLPPHADYFYLTDSGGKAIPAYLKLGVRTNELKDMMQIRIKDIKVDRENDTQLSAIARDVLNIIIEHESDNKYFQELGKIKLVRHKIELNDKTINEKDVVLAEADLSQTGDR